jgi:hypothetical protein
MKYLSTRALEGLKRYQYKPSGYTFLDKIHTPFWNCGWPLRRREAGAAGAGAGQRWRVMQSGACLAFSRPAPARPPPPVAGSVELLPLWLAPNLITLLGTMWLVVAYAVNAYYSPDFQSRQAGRQAAGGGWLAVVVSFSRGRHCLPWVPAPLDSPGNFEGKLEGKCTQGCEHALPHPAPC